MLQSCPDAIDDVFDSKLHIIGGVGVTIGVIMVSVWFCFTGIHQISMSPDLEDEHGADQSNVSSLSPADVWNDL